MLAADNKKGDMYFYWFWTGLACRGWFYSRV